MKTASVALKKDKRSDDILNFQTELIMKINTMF